MKQTHSTASLRQYFSVLISLATVPGFTVSALCLRRFARWAQSGVQYILFCLVVNSTSLRESVRLQMPNVEFVR